MNANLVFVPAHWAGIAELLAAQQPKRQRYSSSFLFSSSESQVQFQEFEY
ncbi:MAG: hypothetical protein ACFB16_22980 [Phormidesmis sp.]